MIKEYNWVVSSMTTKPQEGNLNDVVVNVNWIRQARLIDGNKTYSAESEGSMPCSKPSETDFTAYPDLTFQQVCSWLDAGLNVATIDSSLDALIQTQINPPTVTLPNPWDTPAI